MPQVMEGPGSVSLLQVLTLFAEVRTMSDLETFKAIKSFESPPTSAHAEHYHQVALEQINVKT